MERNISNDLGKLLFEESQSNFSLLKRFCGRKSRSASSYGNKQGRQIPLGTDLFNNEVIHGRALKSVSFVLCEISQRANMEAKLTTWKKRVNNLEMSSVSSTVLLRE